MAFLLLFLMKKQYAYLNTDLKNVPGERWKDIRDYEGSYQISTFGRIKSLPKYTEVYIPSQRHTIRRWSRLSIRRQKVHIRQNAFIDQPCYECTVVLYSESKEKAFMVHRLVYDAFVHPLDFENDKLMVMHKNGDGLDNYYKNLVIGERSDVLKNAYQRKRHISPFATKPQEEKEKIYAKSASGKHKPVIQFNNKGEKIGRFNSIKEASLKTGIADSNIIEVLKGRKSLTKGTFWQYAEKARS
jgi:hypothetical protein